MERNLCEKFLPINLPINLLQILGTSIKKNKKGEFFFNKICIYKRKKLSSLIICYYSSPR